MIDRSVLVHYRTEEAKAFRREHGDRWGVQIRIQVSPPQSVAVEQFDNNSNKRQPIMLNIHLIHEARTEHAKAIAAIREKRNFIGFELNNEYYNMACERIKIEKQQLTLDL